MKKLTYNYVKEYIKKKGYQLLSDDYVNTHTKLLIKCSKGHEYYARFNNFQQGAKCPICIGNKKLSYNYVKDYIEKEDYKLLSKKYKNNKQKLLLKCPIGHEYKISFSTFKNSKHRCPYCADNIKYTYEYVKDFIEKEGYQLLSKEYKNNHTKLLIKCPIGHEYKTTFKLFLKCSCPLCINNNIKYTYEYVKNYIEKEGYKLLSDNYKNVCTKLLLKCPIGHEYEVSFAAFKNSKHRCPICWYESKSSKTEKELQNYIESLGYNIIRNDRTQIINPLTGKNLELDIWIPDKKKAIEYNGTYWHNKLNMIKRDKIKVNQCKQKGIDLLIVKDYNWINCNKIEKEIIKKWVKK